jgi:AraC-like DNA-binding protein
VQGPTQPSVPSHAFGNFRFSTDNWPEAERVALLREVVGPGQLRLHIEPLSENFRVEGAMVALPDCNLFRAACPPVRVSRTPGLIRDGNDDLIFQWTDAPGCYAQRGGEISLAAGEAIALSCADPFAIGIGSPYALAVLRLSRRRLKALLPDAEDCVARPVPANSPALRLLLTYANALRDEYPIATQELRDAASGHLYDLAAIALGGTWGAAGTENRCGIRAARLYAIKGDIRRRLASGALSISAIADRRRLTPRSIQLLFETDGTTFTEFVREERLALAYRMLSSSRYDGQQIAGIALACGFGDVSYFNRQFRAHYGASPSDVRNNRSRN